MCGVDTASVMPESDSREFDRSPMEVRMQTRLARSWSALRYDVSSQRAVDNAAHARARSTTGCWPRSTRSRAGSTPRSRPNRPLRRRDVVRLAPTITRARASPPRAYARELLLYWVVKGVLTPVLRVCFRVKVEGREQPPDARPGDPRLEPPLLPRLDLPAARRAAPRHVRRQGRVLRRSEDRVVLPRRRADPDPARRRQRE